MFSHAEDLDLVCLRSFVVLDNTNAESFFSVPYLNLVNNDQNNQAIGSSLVKRAEHLSVTWRCHDEHNDNARMASIHQVKTSIEELDS
jgi:hypothetical protein